MSRYIVVLCGVRVDLGAERADGGGGGAERLFVVRKLILIDSQLRHIIQYHEIDGR